MKNKLPILMAMFLFLLLLGTSKVYADIIQDPLDQPQTFTYGGNSIAFEEQSFTPTDPDTERIWLRAILGDTDPGPYVGKDEYIDGVLKANDPLYNGTWLYAVLMYGNVPIENLKYDNYDIENDTKALHQVHYAIYNNDNTSAYPNLDLAQGTHALSSVTFFGSTPVPEPATMLLLGSGLVGLASFGRRKFRKN